MLQVINAFTDNIKNKAKNPFFGTLIGVWLVRNWELVYTLFNFDKDCNLSDKTTFVKGYYSNKCFWEELLLNVSIAFGLMIMAYCLLILTGLIANLVEHRINPYLQDKTITGLAVKRTLYEQVKKERLDLQNDLEISNKKLIEIEVANTKYRSEISTLKIDSLQKNNDVVNLQNENNSIKKTSDILKSENQKLEYDNDRFSERNEELLDRIILIDFLNRKDFNKTKNIGIPRIIRTFKNLIDISRKQVFLSLADCIIDPDKTTRISKKDAKDLIDMDLIKINDIEKESNSDSISSNDILLTQHGFSIYKNATMLTEILNKINS